MVVWLQEKEDEASSLKRQADMLAAKKTPTPSPAKEPSPLLEEATGEEEEAEEDLLQQTDDAKVRVVSTCFIGNLMRFSGPNELSQKVIL